MDSVLSFNFVFVFVLLRSNLNGHRLRTVPARQIWGKYLVGWFTIPIWYNRRNGTPSSAILRGGRRRAERNARGDAASRVAAAVKQTNQGFGGRAWCRAFRPWG